MEVEGAFTNPYVASNYEFTNRMFAVGGLQVNDTHDDVITECKDSDCFYE